MQVRLGTLGLLLEPLDGYLSYAAMVVQRLLTGPASLLAVVLDAVSEGQGRLLGAGPQGPMRS